ncbi:hypothetical protein RB619_20500 [Flavobacterium sp. LHD-80]|uniref:hypothetical protein n=1 Tax=Flavobacterium sp. LHD-80 TaxID=3071411 RepID=UPI0027E0807A|nr:hypothetical protein [Flavobacterium sp. LHD-80]MDQ6473028.1 hypothetical protein [Flavobacterium sp. LHD-80]
MEQAIKLKIRKDVNGNQQLNIIKLKGSLITKGYTEIIHILDQDDEFHINSFATRDEIKNEVHDYITSFISKENLVDTVSFLKG